MHGELLLAWFVELVVGRQRQKLARWMKGSFISALVGVLLVFCPGTSAQQYLTATGKPPSATTEPVEMGFVDLSSGSLHLEIPFGSFPQRAHAEPLTMKLIYENHIWGIGSDGSGGWVWSTSQIDGSSPANWHFSNGFWWFEGGAFSAYPCDTDMDFTDTSGTTHFFHVEVGDHAYSCSKASGDFYATDSSGFRLHVVDMTKSDFLLYAPDGTVIPFYDPTYVDKRVGLGVFSEDSNGNYIVPARTGAADDDVYDTADRYFGFSLLASSTNPCPPPTSPNWTCYGVPSSQMVQPPNTEQLTSWYYLTWVTVPVKTAFGQTGIAECTTNCSVTVVQKMTLPDNSTYTFTYDCDSSTGISACSSPAGQAGYYGTLATMTLPTGGTVSYGYETFFDVYGHATRYLNSRTVGSAIWYYSPFVQTTCSSTQVGCQQGVTVQPPDGTIKEVDFTVDNGAWPTLIQTWDTNSELLQSESISWDFSNYCPLDFCVATSYPGSHAYIRKIASTITNMGAGGASVTKKTAYTYDGIQTGNVTGVKEWKYQPGTSPQFAATPDRATYTTYLAAGYNIINKPTRITICNNSGSDADCPGGGSKVSQTIFAYDSYGSGITNVPGMVNHDDTNFSSSNTVRGNVTQISRWVSGSSYLTTQLSYDSTGQVIKMVDPKGNITTYGYTDNFFGDNGTNPPGSFQLADNWTNLYAYTNAYLTSVTDAIGTTTAGYYWGGGKLAVTTDYNGVSRYSHFLDPLDRLTEVDLPASWNKLVHTSAVQTDVYAPEFDTGASTSCSSCVHLQLTVDGWGRPSTTNIVNNPAGAVSVASTYDLRGRLSSMSHPFFSPSDPNHVFENYTYDGLGRTTSLMHPDGQSLSSAYGNEAVVQGGLGSQQGSTSTYGVGTPVLGISESGTQSQEWIDGFGNVIELDEPATGATTLTGQVMIGGYDWNGDPSGSVSIQVNNYSRTVSYDSNSTQDSIATALASAFNSDPASPVSASTATGPDCDPNYSPPNCVVVLKTKTAVSGPYPLSASAVGALGDASGYTVDVGSFSMLTSNPVPTFYTYDVLGHLTSVVQGAQTRTYQYDGLGRPIKSITPEKGTETLSYVTSSGTLCSGDPSNVCIATDARGYVKTYSYDAADRLVQVTHTPSTTGTITYTYGTSAAQFNIGRLVTMTDSSGSETYTYDNMGRMTSLSKVIGGVTYKTSVQYNPAGDVTQLTYPSGRIVQYSYDAVGHLCVVAPSTSSCSSYSNPYLTIASSAFDAADHPLQANYGNGVVASSSFAPARGQLNTLSYSKGSTTYLGLTYRYQNDSTYCPQGSGGNDGRIQCIADTEPGRSVHYTYDTLGRLSTANTTGDSAYPAWGLSETYDRYGNRTAQTVTAGSGPGSSLGINASSNQIVGFGYDASGHVTSEPAPGSSTYTYDAEDCLTNYTGTWNGSSAVYTCDGNHLRVKKVVTGTGAITRVYIFLGSRVITEYDNGAAVTAPSREYIYGQDLLAVVAGGTTNYFHKDHLSVRLITDSNGNVLFTRGHFPFGELWYRSNTTTSNEWIFTTYQRDDESGLDYAQARYYASGFGRFMSADPVEGQQNDPQSWNRYTYSSNDPINNTDPTGMDDNSDPGSGDNPDDPCPECGLSFEVWPIVDDALALGAPIASDFMDNSIPVVCPDGSCSMQQSMTVSAGPLYTPLAYAGAYDLIPYFAFYSFVFDSLHTWFVHSPAYVGPDLAAATNADYINAIHAATAPLAKLSDCAGAAAVSNFAPFGDKLVGEGPKTSLDRAKSGADFVDNAGKVAKHSATIAHALNQMEMPNIAEKVAQYAPTVSAAAEDLALPILAINAAHAAAQTYACYNRSGN